MELSPNIAAEKPKGNYASAFFSIVCLFFFWGFVASSNGVLIPMFKKHFELSQFQSQLVDFAFYAAYFVGSLIYFIISISFGDPLNKIGYKKGLIIGLITSAFGALLFVPAVSSVSYTLFLSGLFIIGLGFALLQIVANPFVINLGDPAKGASRLNLAGGINSLGTTIGPVLLAYILYGKVSDTANSTLGLESLRMPYISLAVVLLLIAVMIALVKMPELRSEQAIQKNVGALQYPQLVMGMIAIFVYVGVEVTVPSNLSALLALPDIKGIDHTQVDKYISLYWGSLMIGRMSGALTTFRINKALYYILSVLIPLFVFGLVMSINRERGADVSDMWIYAAWILLFIVIKLLGQEKPSRTLMLFSLAAVCFLVLGLIAKHFDWGFIPTGDIILFSFMSCGLFCSVMWPCIFNLAIAGLGKYTNQGSSLLVMMILGGAIIPPIQGKIADATGNIHASYWVPVIGFLYLAWYAVVTRRILHRQGIDYETNAAGH